jgi:hypothetical protein
LCYPLALLAGLAQGGERLTPTLDVNDVWLIVTYLSILELVDLQRQYGVPASPRASSARTTGTVSRS